MAKREKVSCGRVLAWACVASASRSLELLPRKIALKFNFRRLKSYRAIVVLNTAPPRPPRKGGLPPYVDYTGMCRWTGYSFWSLSGMVSTIDIPFRFSVLNRARVSNPQRHTYTQTLVKRPSPPPHPLPGAGGDRSSATLQNLD